MVSAVLRKCASIRGREEIRFLQEIRFLEVFFNQSPVGSEITDSVPVGYEVTDSVPVGYEVTDSVRDHLFSRLWVHIQVKCETNSLFTWHSPLSFLSVSQLFQAAIKDTIASGQNSNSNSHHHGNRVFPFSWDAWGSSLLVLRLNVADLQHIDMVPIFWLLPYSTFSFKCWY